MSAEKGDLQIIYNLQWRNKPGNSGDKANIIGIYDTVATTINWKIFKSYLLENSGIVDDDVKVYITDSNTGFPLAIESQADFQIALYEFRRKARRGEIVSLILDRISDNHSWENTRQFNDVETQTDNNEAVSPIYVCRSPGTPAKLFITDMNQGGGKKGGSGYTKIMNLSPELAALVGQETMARHEVVKKVWTIIKEKGLYDPNNKKFVICDDALMKVIGVKRFRFYGMMKYLNSHFIS